MPAFAVYCMFTDASEGTLQYFQKRVEVAEGYDGSVIELNVRDQYDFAKSQWFEVQIYFDGQEEQTLQLIEMTIQYVRTV